MLGVLVHIVFQELDDCHVHVALVHVCVSGEGIVGRGAFKEFCNRDVIEGIVKVLGHGNTILGLLFKEFCDGCIEVAGYGLVIKHQACDGSLHEFGHRDIIRSQVLGDSGLICIGQELGDGGVEELRDADVVGLEVARGGRAEELVHVVVVRKELRHGDVIVREVLCCLHELCHRDVVRLQEVRGGSFEELGDGHIVVLLRQEFRD